VQICKQQTHQHHDKQNTQTKDFELVHMYYA
jgi:hypothetical protein